MSQELARTLCIAVASAGSIANDKIPGSGCT